MLQAQSPIHFGHRRNRDILLVHIYGNAGRISFETFEDEMYLLAEEGARPEF
jgi:hypothetical protein